MMDEIDVNGQKHPKTTDWSLRQIRKTQNNCDDRRHHKVQSAAQKNKQKKNQYTLQNLHTTVNLF